MINVCTYLIHISKIFRKIDTEILRVSCFNACIDIYNLKSEQGSRRCARVHRSLKPEDPKEEVTRVTTSE